MNSSIENKQVKVKKALKTNELKTTIVNNMIKQVNRCDILQNMLNNTNLKGDALFDALMNDSSPDASHKGFLFESICIILIITKCIDNINYTNILNGFIHSLVKVDTVKELLNINVHNGNNPIDFTIQDKDTTIIFSIKYMKDWDECDIERLDLALIRNNISDSKIGLIVKDKTLYENKCDDTKKGKKGFNNKQDSRCILQKKVISDNLLFDEKDIIRGLSVFCKRFNDFALMNVNDFMEKINKEYLGSPRIQLKLKLHQQMTIMDIVSGIENKEKLFCISHKPRSGKSITFLTICKLLLGKKLAKKILIMTTVPTTFDNFKKDLEKYIDYNNIEYKIQDQFLIIDDSFNGIVFCSVQYLKCDELSIKKEQLNKIGFDVIISDESHQGSSTVRTESDILDIGNNKNMIKIFSSGTADKTRIFYNITSNNVFEWEMEDEAYMKKIGKENTSEEYKQKLIKIMTNRHGDSFSICYKNIELDMDYSRFPIQVLVQPSYTSSLKERIDTYNIENNTQHGYCCSKLFALTQSVDDKGDKFYKEEFEICKNSSGLKLLKGFLSSIISNEEMDKTIIKRVEEIQKDYGSRHADEIDPLMIIIFLPTNTRNNTIDTLQKTLKQFLEKYEMWKDYNIEFSNSIGNSGFYSQEYNMLMEGFLLKAKKDNKMGCILFLGEQGSVGITYPKCDLTISLDDGHSLDNQKQKFSRALTECVGKTIGINVDLNIQRNYLYLNKVIQNYRRFTNTHMSNTEILCDLYHNDIFLFNPDIFKKGLTIKTEIETYYKKIATDMVEYIDSIDDSVCLDNIICDDSMREFIKKDIGKKVFNVIHREINEDLEGLHQDIGRGEEIITTHISDVVNEETEKDIEEEKEEEVILTNRTLELCKKCIPALALLSRSYKIYNVINVFTDKRTKHIIMELIYDIIEKTNKNNKIELNLQKYSIIINIMITIINNNQDIVNHIQEIYTTASSSKIRKLIEKHFIPTNDEKKQNAEIPTPVVLVDEMLNTIPIEFWNSPHSVFEPCCGKGNFVLGIFDKFYEGLEKSIPNKNERCRVIMTQCLYYSDLTALNVFITTEILKCHIQSYTGLEELDYSFNSYTGDTLELNVEEHFKVKLFDAVVGNPPYQNTNENGRKALNHNLWSSFITDLFKVINEDGYLLFINPCSWMSPTSKTKDVFYNNYIIYLNINECEKHFNVGSKFSYYLIQKTQKKEKTRVVCLYDKKIYNSEILITNFTFLPNLLCDKSLSILYKFYYNDLEKVSFKTMSELHNTTKKSNIRDVMDNEFIHPIRHTTKNNIRYSNKKHSLSDKNKILLNLSGNLKPIYDDGKLGFTQAQMYLLTDNSNFVEVINSKMYSFIFKICKWSGFNIELIFHNIPFMNEEFIDDTQIYRLFNISEDEQLLIETVV